MRSRYLNLLVIFCAIFIYALEGNPLEEDYQSTVTLIDEFNKYLPQEIQEHLDGDVYVENDEEPQDDGQSAPLEKWEKKRWPNGIVPYVLSSDYTAREKQLIRSGLRDIEAAAPCIRFIEYAEGDSRVPSTHILVVKNTGCWSLIGRTSTGRNQKLALDDYCIDDSKWTIVHEFLHALGFYHEQARPDRDNYITIYWDRILKGGEAQFKTTTRSYDLGVPYDRVSIMQYPNNAFAKSSNVGNTLEWKADPSLPLGGKKLSPKDILQLNRLYCEDGWVKKTTTTTTTTEPKTTKAPRTTTTESTTTTMKPTTTEKMTTTERTTTTTEKPTTTTERMTTTMKPTTTEGWTVKSTTTYEPKTTTTEQPTKVCGDYKGFCIGANPGRCSSYTKRMCPRKCGVCSGPISERCLNLSNDWGDSYCKSLADQGRCQDAVFWRRYNMKRNCAKVCCDRQQLYSYRG